MLGYIQVPAALTCAVLFRKETEEQVERELKKWQQNLSQHSVDRVC